MERSRLSDAGCAGLLAALALAALILLVTIGPARRTPGPERPGPDSGEAEGGNEEKKEKKPKKKHTVPKRMTWFDAPQDARSVFDAIEWEEVYADDFDRSTFGREWLIDDGDWFLEDGRLHCDSRIAGYHDIANIATRFDGTFRITFRAGVPPWVQAPSDLALMTHLPSPRDMQHGNHRNGFYWTLGGDDNAWCGLQTSFFPGWRKEPFLAEPELHIVPGAEHSVEVFCHRNWLLMRLDGKLVLGGYVRDMIRHPQHRFGGFYSFRGPVWIDDFRVFRPEIANADEKTPEEILDELPPAAKTPPPPPEKKKRRRRKPRSKPKKKPDPAPKPEPAAEPQSDSATAAPPASEPATDTASGNEAAPASPAEPDPAPEGAPGENPDGAASATLPDAEETKEGADSPGTMPEDP